MDTRIVKTFLVIVSAGITALLLPIFGQWYYQNTGIDPIGFYMLMGFGGFAMTALTIAKIWDGLK